MSHHKAYLVWKRNTPDFSYESYDRTHAIRFEGGTVLQASSAPEFKGNKERVNPEEMFAAALSSCHMLTFLAIAARSKIIVDEYQDVAVAELAKNASGKLAITKVILSPKIRFADPQPDAAKIARLHEKSH